jgi:hypothetical protein
MLKYAVVEEALTNGFVGMQAKTGIVTDTILLHRYDMCSRCSVTKMAALKLAENNPHFSCV